MTVEELERLHQLKAQEILLRFVSYGDDREATL